MASLHNYRCRKLYVLSSCYRYNTTIVGLFSDLHYHYHLLSCASMVLIRADEFSIKHPVRNSYLATLKSFSKIVS